MASGDDDFLDLISGMCGDENESLTPCPPVDLSTFEMLLDKALDVSSDRGSSALLWGQGSGRSEDVLLLGGYTTAACIGSSSEGGDDAFSPAFAAQADIPSVPSEGRRKRPRPSADEEDARIIALETESHLKKLNIDPDSREGKVERRKIQNRMSAQMHRERKRAYIECLEADVRDRDAAIAKMRLHIRHLEHLLRAAGAEPPAMGDLEADLGTTSESGSDAGYSSSVSSSFGRGQAGGGPQLGLSLFSLLFMLSFGFTLMSRPDMLGSFLSSSSPASIGSFSSAVVPLVGRSPDPWNGYGRILLAAGPEVSDFASADDDAYDNYSPAANDRDKAKRVSESHEAYFSSENCSLWNFEGTVVRLYPGRIRNQPVDAKSTAQTDTADTADIVSIGALVTTFPPLHQISTPSQTSLRGNARESHQERGVEQHRALVPTSESYEKLGNHGSASHTRVLPGDHFTSQILMTHGKALLDPSLVRTTRIMQKNSFGFADRSEEFTHVTHLNNNKRHDGRTESALVAPSVFRPLGTDNSNIAHSPPNTALGSPTTPQFLMMLPLASVKWGTSWDDDDSSSNPITQLLKALHDNSSSVNHHDDLNSYWIEIGCSITKAQLVKNLTKF